MSELVRRTHCYVMQPNLYEIDGCPNSTLELEHKVTWSEYEKHLWCFVCEQDFIPAHAGIFDGPIPMGLALTMGLSFDRVNIETGQIVENPYKSVLTNEEHTEEQ